MWGLPKNRRPNIIVTVYAPEVGFNGQIIEKYKKYKNSYILITKQPGIKIVKLVVFYIT